MNIDKQYQKLLQDIIHNGVEKKDRTGTGTISVFGRQIRHRMSEGFPLLTTKKMAFKTMVTELLWFLRGDTSIKYLLENNCNIWNGDAWARYEKNAVVGDVVDSHYEPATDKWHLYNKEEFISKIKTDDEFASKWGDLGKIYGFQWRNWEKCELTNDDDFGNNESWGDWNIKQIDQIANLISELKTNPDSRRLMVNAWNVGELDQMVLPPCHYGFQVYTRELSLEERVKLFSENVNGEHLMKYADSDGLDVWNEILNKHNIPTRAISLMWNQRSCDFPLGIPANIMSYALLLTMFAKQLNMVPDELIGNLGDCHIYLNQIEGVKEQLTREPYELPTVKLLDRVVNDISEYTLNDIILENYQSHPKIYFPLSN
jgi:thymidylate synthase